MNWADLCSLPFEREKVDYAEQHLEVYGLSFKSDVVQLCEVVMM